MWLPLHSVLEELCNLLPLNMLSSYKYHVCALWKIDLYLS